VKLFQELSRTYGLTEDLLGCSGLP
jgi:hypothetical protein